MKVKKIASLCKERAVIYLYNTISNHGELIGQCIGDGVGLYPITGLPIMGEGHIQTLLEIPESKKQSYRMFLEDLPSGIPFSDTHQSEQRLERLPLSFNWGGSTLAVLRGKETVFYLNEKYLAPLPDKGEPDFFLRKAEGGTPCIAVKYGLLVEGLIAPVTIDNALVEYITEISMDLESRENGDVEI